MYSQQKCSKKTNIKMHSQLKNQAKHEPFILHGPNWRLQLYTAKIIAKIIEH